MVLKNNSSYVIEKLIDFGIIELLIEILEKNEDLQILEIIELFIIYEKTNQNFTILNILQCLGRKQFELLAHQSNNKMIKLKAASLLNYLRDLEI